MTPPPSPDQTAGGPSADTQDPPVAADTAATGDDAVATPDGATPETTSTPALAQTAPTQTAALSLTKTPDPDNAELGDSDVPGDEDDGDVPLEDDVVTGGPRDTLIPIAGTILALVALAALLMVSFVLPAAKSGPHQVPLGIAGPEAFNTQIKTGFSRALPKQFELKVYPNATALRKAIEDRTVYGGITLDAQQTAVVTMVSEAAGPLVADQLGQIGSSLQGQVTDVKPLPAKDPLGVAFNAAGLPLALAGIFPALILIMVFRRDPLKQFGGAIGAAFLTALAAAAILTFWIGATAGSNYWLLSVALFAGLLTSGLILIGLNAIGGRIATGVGVAVLALVSIPLSGFTSAPEWLPQPWGDVGQLLPAGAGGTLLRNAAFFDGHAVGKPLAVLGVWALIGLLMLLLSETMSESMFRTGPDEAELRKELG